MVTEQHIGECFVKIYSSERNKHLLFLLPGQSMSPRAFWDFKLSDGTTHAEYLFNLGIDIVLFDPVGYGNSKHFYSYDRLVFAKHIHSVTSQITKKYDTKTILGFSTSTAPALIASQEYFNKVIIVSPSIRNDRKYFVIHDDIFYTGIDKLKNERLHKISDKLIPTSNRINGWEEKILDVMGEREWKVPAQVVYDINNYWVNHRNNGFVVDKVPPVLTILGEYDYEATTGGYEEFCKLFPDAKTKIIPNSTHFSMWENSCEITLQAVGEWSKIPCL